MCEKIKCLLAISVACLCLTILSLVFSLPAYANPGDVLVNRATGVDQAGCGGAGNPCYSIKYAVETIAVAGDRVLVAPATYTETFLILTDSVVTLGSLPLRQTPGDFATSYCDTPSHSTCGLAIGIWTRSGCADNRAESCATKPIL